ncbi:MAG: NosD domain-containing protein [Promethearchaeia archaeon]
MIYKIKKEQLVLLIFVFNLIIFVNSLINYNSEKNITLNPSKNDNELISEDLKSSKYWDNFTFIHIKNNWTNGVSKGWIKGDGSYNNPYIIENMTIDATGSPTGCGILIEDSKNDYFIIRNCTIKNSGVNIYDGGIKILNSANGTIINNNCSNNNKFGIILYQSKNATVYNNTINNNAYGIGLFGGNKKNQLSQNIIRSNSKCGINITLSANNSINGNNINSSTANCGISLFKSSRNNFTQNIINGQKIGILIFNNSNNNTFYKNNIVNNSNYGVWIKTDTLSCGDNLFYNNSFSNPGSSAINARDDYSNNWNNTIIGNKWHNYTGFDEDDDGIGDKPYIIDADSKDFLPIYNDGFNSSEIYINALAKGVNAHNWSWAEKRFWCSGSGTKDDPYVIKNLLIDNNRKGSAIIINNSRVFFTIQNCTVFNSSNKGAGIKLVNTTNGIIQSCKIENNTGYGILMINTNKTSIINSTISNNTLIGILVAENSNNNNFTGNKLTKNNVGIGINHTSCSANLIWNNNFTQSFSHQASDNGTNNFWNNTLIGNYWDDYTGKDMDDNGIGETPYDIWGSSNNKDYLPIWQDGPSPPLITKIFPANNTKYSVAPILNISVYDADFRYLWYNISNQKEFLQSGVSEAIRADIWNNIPDESWFIIEIYANDSKGNINNTFTLRLYKDISSPRIHLTGPANKSSVILPPSFKINVSDPNLDKIWYNVTGLPGIEFLKNDTFEELNDTFWNSLGEGWFTINFFANDTLGNVNNTYSLLLYKDINAPKISILQPVNLSNWAAPGQILIIASDHNLDKIWYNISGLPNIEFLNNNTAEIFNDTFWNNLPDGWFTINIFANDTFGRLNDTFSIMIYKDTRAPSIIINNPGNQTYWTNKNLTPINITAIDKNLHYIWYTIDGLPGLEFLNNNTLELINLTKFWNSLPQGWFTIRIYANDTLGHINNTFNLVVYKDLLYPLVQILNPSNNSIYSSPPIIKVIAFDISLDKIWYICNGVKVFLNNNTNVNLSNAIWNTLNEGIFNIYIFANDTAGNQNNLSISLIKDTQPPELVLKKFNIGTFIDIAEVADVYISWTVEDTTNIKYIEIKLDDNDWIRLDGNISEYTFDDVSLGNHKIIIRAFDSAGYNSSILKEFTIERPSIEQPVEMALYIIFIAAIAGVGVCLILFFKMEKSIKGREIS